MSIFAVVRDILTCARHRRKRHKDPGLGHLVPPRLGHLVLREELVRQKYPNLDRIEQETGHEVSIATRVTAENLANCHPQEQSPLFGLPAELRDLIFTFILAPEPAKATARNIGQVFTTSILLTCRRVWLEANLLALIQAEPTFKTWESTKYTFMANLTSNNRQNLERMRVLREIDMERVVRYDLDLDGGMGALWPPHVTMQLTLFPTSLLGVMVYAHLRKAVMAWLQAARWRTRTTTLWLVLDSMRVMEDEERRALLQNMIFDVFGRGEIGGWKLRSTQRGTAADDTEWCRRLVTLEWCRVDDADNVPDMAERNDIRDLFPGFPIRREEQEAMARFRKRWMKQGSLLIFGGRTRARFTKIA